MHSRILPDVSDRIPGGVQRDGQDSDIPAKLVSEHFGGVAKQFRRPRASPITACVDQLENHAALTNHLGGGGPPPMGFQRNVQQLRDRFRALNLP